MPRWGDNGAKGTKQQDTRKARAAYIAGGTAAGAGVAGAGYGAMRSGQGLEARSRAWQGHLQGAMTSEVAHRKTQRRAAGAAERSSTSALNRVNNMANRPAVMEANRRAVELGAHGTGKFPKKSPQVKARAAARSNLSRALNHPGFQSDLREAQAAMHEMRTQRQLGIHLRGRQAETSRAIGGIGRLERRAGEAVKRGAGRAKWGKRAMFGAVGVPLAAMATSGKVSRDWAGGNRRGPRQYIKPVEKPSTHGMNAAERKASESGNWNAFANRGKGPLTKAQEDQLANAIQTKPWALTASERRHQTNRGMQAPPGGWR